MIALPTQLAASSKTPKARIVALVFVCLLVLWHFSSLSLGSSKYKKPANQRIVGMVFYGRARYVEILDCYLQRNLASNGGFLDEVLFLADTKDEKDLDWLKKLVEETPEYTRIDTNADKLNFLGMWQHAQEPDTIYVKIDDDVVWINDDTIPRMVDRLQAHPEALAIAANIINSPVSQWFHYRTGAIRPFLPETISTEAEAREAPRTQWRTSFPHLPYHPENPEKVYENYTVEPAFSGSRMLPLEPGHDSLKWTPLYKTSYGPVGDEWKHWASAQQHHYSFFYNLEHGYLDRYWFGGLDGTWNLHNDHYNLNFLVIRGRDIDLELIKKVNRGDEKALTEDIPRILDRPVLLDSKALMVHYAYGKQRPLLKNTDVLTRYRALANERYCYGRLGDEFRY